MRTNLKAKDPVVRTHEGAKAVYREKTIEKLRRSLSCCLLWENSFYEDGVSIAARIAGYVPQCSTVELVNLVKEVRDNGIRHAPLLVVREMMRYDIFKPVIAELVEYVCDRPDQLIELLSIYWQDRPDPKVKKLPYQMIKGGRKALAKFDAYALAKYKNEDKQIKLRDVVRLFHPKPKDEAQAEAFKQLLSGELKRVDTWEDLLSAGNDKKETFTKLIQERKLGGLALIRNLRNMQESGVDYSLVREAIENMKVDRIEPFRLLKAGDHGERYQEALENRLFESCKKLTRIKGHTLILLDVSGSMSTPISAKSEVKRCEVAFGLGTILKEVCEETTIFGFDSQIHPIYHSRGFALYKQGQNPNGGATYIGRCLQDALKTISMRGVGKTNVVIITDMQAHDEVPSPKSFGGRGFMLNVASYEPSIAHGTWEEMTGFSERAVEYIARAWAE